MERACSTLDGGRDVAVHDFIAVHRHHIVFAVSLGSVEQPTNSSLLT